MASLLDSVSDSLFSVAAERLAEALARLPRGALWRHVAPGADPAATVALLGPGAGVSLRAAVAPLLAEADAGALLGLPFSVRGAADPGAVAAALLSGAAALPAPPGSDGGFPGCSPADAPLPDCLVSALAGRPVEVVADPAVWRVEVRHLPRSGWEALAGRCVEWAAREALSGALPDPLGALVACPGADLSGVVGLADADARLRFVEALADAGDGPGARDRFLASPFRRSCAAGLAQAAGGALAAVPGGQCGRDEEGWPASWTACAERPEALLAAFPPGVLRMAAAVRVGVPGGSP